MISELKWGHDAKTDRTHHWKADTNSHHLHRQDLESLIGRPPRVQEGDVLGHATVVPEERHESGSVVAPGHVLLHAQYDAHIPEKVFDHFRKNFPDHEVRRGNHHQRVAMAERSGDPELDKLIEEFPAWFDSFMPQIQSPNVSDRPRPLNEYRIPENAEGMCGSVNQVFLLYLNKKGIKAEFSASPYDTADNLGYEDRSIPGKYVDHGTVFVTLLSGTYSVDWTAAQYGYKEFPMVQKLDDGKWQRDWASSAKTAKTAAEWMRDELAGLHGVAHVAE